MRFVFTFAAWLGGTGQQYVRGIEAHRSKSRQNTRCKCGINALVVCQEVAMLLARCVPRDAMVFVYSERVFVVMVAKERVRWCVVVVKDLRKAV
jgi:hypothetical protein